MNAEYFSFNEWLMITIIHLPRGVTNTRSHLSHKIHLFNLSVFSSCFDFTLEDMISAENEISSSGYHRYVVNYLSLMELSSVSASWQLEARSIDSNCIQGAPNQIAGSVWEVYIFTNVSIVTTSSQRIDM